MNNYNILKLQDSLIGNNHQNDEVRFWMRRHVHLSNLWVFYWLHPWKKWDLQWTISIRFLEPQFGDFYSDYREMNSPIYAKIQFYWSDYVTPYYLKNSWNKGKLWRGHNFLHANKVIPRRLSEQILGIITYECYYLSIIKHESLEIVCSPKITFNSWLDTSISFKTLN